MSEIGTLIMEKRSQAGLSLKELSKRCGISDTEIMKIENGTRKNPNWSHLCKISEGLELHPFDFMIMAGYISEKDIAYASRLKHIEKLNDENIKVVQAFIDFMILKQQ